ncbi:MAG: T9SS type A sorting domain-containing protein [Nonlabens sp.]|uniref:T9SS type A sorting domain-containing protein n=1 Tax=Nonlabens sp. TaxID=1888209 RepID=UPI00321B4997
MQKITFLLILFITTLGFSQSLPMDFEVAEDDAWGAFNGTVATVLTDPTDSSNTVLEMIGAGVDFDGAAITLDTYIDLSDDANNTISMRIWAPDATLRTHILKLEGGSTGATELTFTTNMMGWQTVNIDFGVGLGTEYPIMVIFTDSTSGNTATGTYYIDDINGPNGAVIPVDPIPMGPAPIPSNPDATVYSIYNDTNNYTTTFPVAYSFGTLSGELDLDSGAAVNNALKFNFAVAGWGQGEALDDVSSYGFFSFNYWASAGTVGFNIELISRNGGAGGPVTGYIYEYGGANATIVTDSWQTVSIPMSTFTALGFDDVNFFQWKIDPYQQSVNNAGIVYFDNIMFTQTTLSVSTTTNRELSISPNPTNDIWNISAQDLEIDSIQVYDLTGKLLINDTNNSSNARIDGTTLRSGIYIARITSGESIQSIKLIKD